MMLVGADEWLRAALDVGKVSAAVPLARSWEEAIYRIDTRPSVVRRHHDVPRGAKVGEVVRQTAREVCRDWGIEDLVFPVTTIATELATNAIEHTGLSCTLSYMLDARGMHTAVRDHRPASRTDLRAMHDLLGTGYGLKVVENLARWGVIPHHDGKTVWASLERTKPP
jgi:anti-sigma regulatory factor (Ser/Thr protein kinase)